MFVWRWDDFFLVHAVPAACLKSWEPLSGKACDGTTGIGPGSNSRQGADANVAPPISSGLLALLHPGTVGTI